MKFELGPDRRIMLTVPFVVGDQFISLASPALKLKPDRGIVKGFWSLLKLSVWARTMGARRTGRRRRRRILIYGEVYMRMYGVRRGGLARGIWEKSNGSGGKMMYSKDQVVF